MVAKHARDMHGLRRANQATAQLLAEVAAVAGFGITTADLDAPTVVAIQWLEAEPVCRSQSGFPVALALRCR